MNYTLKLPWEQYQKLQVYADNVDTEIGGLGKVTLDLKEGEFTITDVFLLEQEASSGECELSSEGIAVLYDELLDAGENVDDIKMWWHSHGGMGVFFSKTDTDTMDEWPGDWIIALVINKKKELKARFQVQYPIPMYMDLGIEIEYPVVVNIQELKDEILQKVTHPTTVITKYNGVPVMGGYTSGWKPPEKTNKWKDSKHFNKSNNYGWDDLEEDTPTSLHRMTGSEYDQLMQEEYGVVEVAAVEETPEEAEKYNEWFARFAKASEELNLTVQFELIEEALKEGILEAEEVEAYLTDTELVMFMQ